MSQDLKTAKFEWVDNWVRIPDTSSGRENGRTHGVCVTKGGNVIVFHQAQNGLLTFDPQGKLVSAVGGDRWLGAHGLTLIVENGQEYLWLADQDSTEVVKTTLKGEVVKSLPRPDHPAYQGDRPQKYTPTWAAQNPANGDIWIADGYGASLVHRYNKDGTYRNTIDGTEGAGRFSQPHGINFTVREGRSELFITDRANRRIVVYDGEGRFLRQSDMTHSPCCFDFLNGTVVVPELFTGVKLLDIASLQIITEVGASDYVKPRTDGGWWPPETPKGWPNLASTEHVRPNFFNSPHGGCFAPNGDIYVVEWIIGGRITKLAKR